MPGASAPRPLVAMAVAALLPVGTLSFGLAGAVNLMSVPRPVSARPRAVPGAWRALRRAAPAVVYTGGRRVVIAAGGSSTVAGVPETVPPSGASGAQYLPRRLWGAAQAPSDWARLAARRMVRAAAAAAAAPARARLRSPSPAPDASTASDPVIAYTQSDVLLIARVVRAEAGNQPYDAMVGVAAVIVNRVRDGWDGGTVSSVIFAPGQFQGVESPLFDLPPEAVDIQAASNALAGEDPTGGALHFYNPTMTWAGSPIFTLTVTATYGALRFARSRAPPARAFGAEASSGEGRDAFVLEGSDDGVPSRWRRPGVDLRAEWIQLPGDGTPLGGYLARPERADAPLPGVLVIQEMWGVDAHIEDLARRYAEAGYVALAPDLFSPGGSRPAALARDRVEAFKGFVDAAGPAAWAPDGMQAALQRLPQAEAAAVGETQETLMAGAMRNPAAHVAHLRAAAGWLRAQPHCDRHVGSVGYCMGGGLSAQLATADAGIEVAIIYYGASLAADRVGDVKCPVFGFYGGEDVRINEGVPAFADAMAKAGKIFVPRTYPGAPHAFFNDTRPSFRAGAARDAWARTLGILADHLA